jgi:hypothetical protein
MSLLDELAEDFHALLLEKGNLPGSPLRKSSLWTGENNWRITGQTAKVLQTACNCGEVSSTLLGIFTEETNGTGARRLTRSLNPSLGGKIEIEKTQSLHCAHCLSALNFE